MRYSTIFGNLAVGYFFRGHHIYCQGTYCVHLTSRCLELSSGDSPTKRALISNYNELVCSSRVKFTDESVQVLHSPHGETDGRFSG